MLINQSNTTVIVLCCMFAHITSSTHVVGDIAFYQPATQSSDYLAYVASYAVDAQPNSTCAIVSNTDSSPAWGMVDLGALYDVTTVWLLATTLGKDSMTSQACGYWLPRWVSAVTSPLRDFWLPLWVMTLWRHQSAPTGYHFG